MINTMTAKEKQMTEQLTHIETSKTELHSIQQQLKNQLETTASDIERQCQQRMQETLQQSIQQHETAIQNTRKLSLQNIHKEHYTWEKTSIGRITNQQREQFQDECNQMYKVYRTKLRAKASTIEGNIEQAINQVTLDVNAIIKQEHDQIQQNIQTSLNNCTQMVEARTHAMMTQAADRYH